MQYALDYYITGAGSFTLRDGAVHLGRLLVDPGQRGQGLGTLLLTELLEHARLHSPELARGGEERSSVRQRGGTATSSCWTTSRRR